MGRYHQLWWSSISGGCLDQEEQEDRSQRPRALWCMDSRTLIEKQRGYSRNYTHDILVHEVINLKRKIHYNSNWRTSPFWALTEGGSNTDESSAPTMTLILAAEAKTARARTNSITKIIVPLKCSALGAEEIRGKNLVSAENRSRIEKDPNIIALSYFHCVWTPVCICAFYLVSRRKGRIYMSDAVGQRPAWARNLNNLSGYVLLSHTYV